MKEKTPGAYRIIRRGKAQQYDGEVLILWDEWTDVFESESANGLAYMFESYETDDPKYCEPIEDES